MSCQQKIDKSGGNTYIATQPGGKMNTPNEYVRLKYTKDYIADRLAYEDTRRKLEQIKVKRPSRFYCAICHGLVNVGHVFVAFGRRLERFDLVLRNSQT